MDLYELHPGKRPRTCTYLMLGTLYLIRRTALHWTFRSKHSFLQLWEVFQVFTSVLPTWPPFLPYSSSVAWYDNDIEPDNDDDDDDDDDDNNDNDKNDVENQDLT